uniref:Uncharacterized protein n=2 Tax=Octactis speculum TaxID=3111310 RepID=A0A7S2DKB9_9STRA|mmetsp:Transcript_5049/g.6138  ORF Transcript_5049/g.6138 Transcript_5049/m.6138 type:complete len:180 (+) Transcript_5049:564-1103(+)
MSGLDGMQRKSKKARGMPKCGCVQGCTACITSISQPMNIILYLVFHQWAEWRRSYLARAPKVGEKMLFRYHNQDVPCRVIEISQAGLYTVRWPPDKKDLKPGNKMAAKKSIPRKFLRFRDVRFPRSWANWLVKHLHLVEGGTAEVAYRRQLMGKKIAFTVWNTKRSNNSKFHFVPSSWL